MELQSEPPPTKKRKCRENSNIEKGTKNSEKADSQKGVSEPVEIIPLMPNLKLEMPEYLEQDGSSCSYDDQSAGDSNKLGIDDNPSDNQDNDQKPDISQTFYSNQSTSDSLDGKQAELGKFRFCFFFLNLTNFIHNWKIKFFFIFFLLQDTCFQSQVRQGRD